jgi:hypothetical protein
MSHPAVGGFQHHLGVGAGLFELQFQGDRVVDDTDRAELLAALGLADDHRPLPMKIDTDELFSSYSLIGASYVVLDVTPPASAGNPTRSGGPAPTSHQAAAGVRCAQAVCSS